MIKMWKDGDVWIVEINFQDEHNLPIARQEFKTWDEALMFIKDWFETPVN